MEGPRVVKPSRPPAIDTTKSYRAAGLLLVFMVIAAIVFVFVKNLVFDRP